MPPPCTVHQWSHPTEPCPYCREIDAPAGNLRPHVGRRHETASPTNPDAVRAERLSTAIVAVISGDASKVTDLFTQDVVGSGPTISVSSREELASKISERNGALADIEVALAPLDVAGPQAAVEWVASGVQTGPLVLDERLCGALAPPGHRIRVRAVTVADFDGEQICSFRSYWDDLPLLQDVREAPRS